MNEPGPDEAKHILIHIVTPVSVSMLAYAMLLGERYSIPEAALLFLGGAGLLFYAFSNTIEIAEQRLNDGDAARVE